MTHSEENSNVTVLPPDTAKIRKLWKVAGILGIVTALEFLVAFTIPHEYATLRVWIFIGMTIIKAAYIVGEFMHLRYETKLLIWSILIPLIFIVWMLAAFIYDGIHIGNTRF